MCPVASTPTPPALCSHEPDRRLDVLHAGDTGYFAGFREIGRRLSPEVALLPIGAYNPAQFRNVHADPADAMTT